MATVADRVTDEALSLPVDARLVLVEKLIHSLNPSTDSDLDRLWADEAESRVAGLDAGQARLITGEEVFARIRAKYGK